jgi:hypothetical protein
MYEFTCNETKQNHCLQKQAYIIIDFFYGQYSSFQSPMLEKIKNTAIFK